MKIKYINKNYFYWLMVYELEFYFHFHNVQVRYVYQSMRRYTNMFIYFRMKLIGQKLVMYLKKTGYLNSMHLLFVIHILILILKFFVFLSNYKHFIISSTHQIIAQKIICNYKNNHLPNQATPSNHSSTTIIIININFLNIFKMWVVGLLYLVSWVG